MEERPQITVRLPDSLYRWLMEKVQSNGSNAPYPDVNQAIIALLIKQKVQEEATPACPRCGSPGEWLGSVEIPDHAVVYAQYRCTRCGNGFLRPQAPRCRPGGCPERSAG
ncbi:hypothetical protein FGU65_12600 [Methanoculleus sp. FWC-SCC1]|uniref:CopG-like ribbon-helix-helix domain-containing protein n=1 Tax=Methanoculleus frigidifontis TaxID=2584085 RepID=A0ABT8MCN6_9EURY|nr:hypothetical protein [Methanoculleus sp. FWC-SCC1]MDN7025710.1 hypothetical protein [Methanoculleus sp. FWC-SCC1]